MIIFRFLVKLFLIIFCSKSFFSIYFITSKRNILPIVTWPGQSITFLDLFLFFGLSIGQSSFTREASGQYDQIHVFYNYKNFFNYKQFAGIFKFKGIQLGINNSYFIFKAVMLVQFRKVFLCMTGFI